MSKRRPEDYALYLIIGSLYAFAANISILNTTILHVPYLSLFLIGLAMLLFFMLVFWNLQTFLGFLGFVAFLGLFLFQMRERMEDFWYFVGEIILVTRGAISFRAEFTWPMVLSICLLVALYIAICLYVNFHFYLLAGFGAVIFIICWMMDYPQSLLGFILYLFCFCVFLVRKLQGPHGDGTRASLIAAPLCAAVVWAVSLAPIPSAALDNPTITRLLNEPWEVVSEFFFLAFNPRYFSFQTTGFAGQGGRLGGPVSPNNRLVMAVDSDRRAYLSGATHDVYTGFGWTSSDTSFEPADSRIHPSYIEFLETSNALFREASRFEISGAQNNDLRFISYMPLSNLNIFVGNNRTGSLFRPMRERGIRFDDPGLNNLLLLSASGDRRLTQLIPRHAVYRYNFLELDYRDEHIRNILRSSRRGLYRDRISNPEPLIFNIYNNGASYGWVSLSQYNPNIFQAEAIVANREIFSAHFDDLVMSLEDMQLFLYEVLDFFVEGEMVAIGASLVLAEDFRFPDGDDYINGLAYEEDYELAEINFPIVLPSDLEFELLESLMQRPEIEMQLNYLQIEHRVYSGAATHRIHRNDINIDGFEGFDEIISSFTALANGDAELFYNFNQEAAHTLLNLKAGLDIDTLLAEHADYVYENFLALPDGLPQRVIDHAFEITADYDTDYDKIRALQEYLVRIPYTLSPGVVPRDRDFVDYFLFDAREGYCVYYASAMVVMSRALGIPARYVEGFLLPPQRDPYTGLFTVTNRNAHAWAEVYFEGFGWLIVETTAPYVYAMYERPIAAISDIFAGGFMLDMHYEEYLRQMGLWYQMQGMDGWDWDFAGDFPIGLGGGAPLADVELAQVNLWYLSLGFLVSVPGIIFLYLFAHESLRLYRRFKLKRMNNNDRTIYYYKEILKITSYWKNPMEEGETPYTYAHRMRNRFAFVNETVYLSNLNDLYYRAKYGSRPITDDEAEQIRYCYYELVSFVKSMRSWHNFFYIRYVKSVIAL